MRNEYIPIIDMRDVFNGNSSGNHEPPKDIANKLLVIVESAGKLVGLVVDDLLEQQQVVLKSLEANYEQIDCMAGATILGDGTVSLIIDIPGLIETCFGSKDKAAMRELAAA